MNPISRVALVVSFVAPFLAAFLSLMPTARGQSRPTPSVTNGVVAAVARAAAEPDGDTNAFVVVDGQRQLLVTATPDAPLLWRTSGHALTDIVSRLTEIGCDEDEVAWQVDGRTVLCTEPSRHGLTEAQAAVGQLQHIRILATGHPRMTDPIAAALAPRAIGLVQVIEYARRHHGRAPHAARAKRGHRHH
ncbi:hypothetical protein KBD61_02235 [Patescibacteria group bacterium]|nr:hypothetical protein [Patescibacteria group bacterium]MBP9709827.1 hypothetical protein [Patescibacteria group bacterium]